VAVPVGILGIGLLAAATLLDPPGLQWPVIGAGITAVAALAARRTSGADVAADTTAKATGTAGGAGALDGLGGTGQPGPTRSRRGDAVLAGIALLLVGVAAVRTSPVMITLCLFGALGLAAAAAFGARSWTAVLLTPAAVPIAGLRALPWVSRGLAGGLGRARLTTVGWAWIRAATLGVVLVGVVAALLASADEAFAGLLTLTLPDFDLALLPWRIVVGGLVVGLALPLAFGAAAQPRWQLLERARRGRPAVEWLLPVLLVALVLGAFLLVQAAVLFDAYPDSLLHGHETPAERARSGFGQLVVVTLLVAGLLGWAGQRVAAADRAGGRRAFTAAGGTLLGLVLVLVASAIRRLWLYEQAFGWTVLRLNVGAFEIWLAVMLVLVGVAWLARRGAWVPRLVIGSAGAALALLGMIGPDAVVASWNVDRYLSSCRSDCQQLQDGKFDADYARRLSADAVPALLRLPASVRACVLAGRGTDLPPWYAANISRIRAAAALRSIPALPTELPDGCRPDAS
jgi:hypothetical protein